MVQFKHVKPFLHDGYLPNTNYFLYASSIPEVGNVNGKWSFVYIGPYKVYQTIFYTKIEKLQIKWTCLSVIYNNKKSFTRILRYDFHGIVHIIRDNCCSARNYGGP